MHDGGVCYMGRDIYESTWRMLPRKSTMNLASLLRLICGGLKNNNDCKHWRL